MATIGSIVVRGVYQSGVAAGALRDAKAVAQMAATIATANPAIKAMTSSVRASSSAMQDADQKATSHLKTLLKIGTASAMVATAVKAAYNRDKAQDALSKAQGGEAGPSSLAAAYERVQGAVTSAYEAFGQAFAQSSGLAGVMDQLANILANLTPAFEMVGHAIGGIVGFLTSASPLALAFGFALKAAIVAAGLLAAAGLFLLKSWALGKIIFWLTNMTKWQLLCAAGQWAWNAAITATNVLMAILAAIGLPLWGAIAVAIGIAAAALYGLVKAWQWITSSHGEAAQTASDIKSMADAAKKAGEEAERLEKELDNALNQALNPEGLHRLADLERALDKNGASAEEAARRLDEFDAKLAELNGIKKRTEALKDLAESQQKAATAGMTETQKAVHKSQERHDTPAMTNAIAENLRIADARTKYYEKQKKMAEELAEIEKLKRQAGLTPNQIRVDNLVNDYGQMGLRPDEAERVQASLDEAERINKLAEDRKQLAKDLADIQFKAATFELSTAQKVVESLRKRGETAENIAKAQKAADAIDVAEQKKKDMEEGKRMLAKLTPLEEYKKRVADIQRLLSAGALGTGPAAANAAKIAMEDADKDFRGSFKDTSYKYESPKAMFAGTAETALAANRQRNPIDNLTQVQREQLAEQKKLKTLAEQQLAATKENKPAPEMVADSF